MTLYIRGYSDYSYEIIFLDGVFRKSRVHILINPGVDVKLPGQAEEGQVEINIESLTHILSMQTSVKNREMLKRTVYLAERTNKPVITNQSTATYFKEHGLSVKQLRIIGFQEEVVEGIKIDPVYLDELSDEIIDLEPKSSTFSLATLGSMINKVNPLKWKPIKKITNTVLPLGEKEKQDVIDESQPLAFQITLGSKLTLLLPLDKRGVRHLDHILPQHDIHTLILPNQDIGYIKKISGNLSHLLILSEDLPDDDTLIVPKSHNIGVNFDTTVGGIEEWIEIK